MSLEQEIKDFMHEQGVDVVGVAGPGRFDGPPSLDPNYIMRGAKSIITFAVPFDVQAIYDFLEKRSTIPHNLDQMRAHQRAIHAGKKLTKFLEGKGCKATIDSPNIKWRGTLNAMAYTPRFSHRYGSYVTGIAAPGLSGNSVTKEYGAAMVLNTVFTSAVLESDPIMDPREIIDNVCQSCMACAASCPTKMFERDKEEYALINGLLYPRGLKRDINLCSIGCGGMHAPAPNLKYSNWGQGYIEDWFGVIPDPEKQNILVELTKATFAGFGYGAMDNFKTMDAYSIPYEEGIFEAPNFPDYEDLPGETEGEKLMAYKAKMEELLDVNLLVPSMIMTCGSCMVVCGSNKEENQKRWKMLCKSGFVVYGKNYEPVWTHDPYEALELKRAVPIPIEAKKDPISFIVDAWMILAPKFGIDIHGALRKGKYYRRLNQAIAEQGKQDAHIDPNVRETVMEEIGALDGMPEKVG